MRRNRGLVGPVVLITIGTLFAVDHIWGWWDFSRTWPIILIAIGVVKLVERFGYDAYAPPPPRPWGPPGPPLTPPPMTPPATAQPPGTISPNAEDNYHAS